MIVSTISISVNFNNYIFNNNNKTTVDRNGKVDQNEMAKIIEAIYDLLGEEHRKGENAPNERVKTIMKVVIFNSLIILLYLY